MPPPPPTSTLFPSRRSSDLVYGKGANVRDWLYVGDHAAALALVLERGRIGETYNIRSEEHTSELQSPVQLVCRLLLEKKKSLDRDFVRGFDSAERAFVARAG